jgi:hypothetical protein
MSDSNKNLVIIIGAGASYEVGLPTGLDLKKNIASILDVAVDDWGRYESGDKIIFQALKSQYPSGFSDVLSLCQKIRKAMPLAISIDNYIDANRGNKKIEFIAKLAIVKSILDAEMKSKIYIDGDQENLQLKYDQLNKCWLNNFFRLLTENCHVDSLKERLERVSLIVFNYDRCIEHYLYFAFQMLYPDISSEKAIGLIGMIKIYHPYGKMGDLHWQAGPDFVKYGHAINEQEIKLAASRIKTFTEGTDPESSDIKAIKNTIALSDKVLFLGFGFHDLNMKLIGADVINVGPCEKRIFATACGISEDNCERIQYSFAQKLGISTDHVKINSKLTCAQIFDEYSKSLAMG